MKTVKGKLDAQFENPFAKNDSIVEEDDVIIEEVEDVTSSDNNNDNVFDDDPFKDDELSLDTEKPVIPVEEQRKYNIIDMFWMIHPKYGTSEMKPNSADICVIGFNATFGNLRVEFRKMCKEYKTDRYIVQTKCDKITSFNIYSEEAFIIREKIIAGKDFEHIVTERIINQQNWYPNYTKIVYKASSNVLGIVTQDRNTNTKTLFVISPEQMGMFMSALDFMVNGTAWMSIILGR